MMGNNETTTDDKPVDHISDCTDQLYRIAEALERIANVLDNCSSVLNSEAWAFRTIPITD
jgi:hypothetical protein